jgi:hypothetical protein
MSKPTLVIQERPHDVLKLQASPSYSQHCYDTFRFGLLRPVATGNRYFDAIKE